jgi:REP element-mobilizing transposase RayT
MAHTFANLLTHVIFSTKDREPLIDQALNHDLLAYMGGIVRELQGKVSSANSMPDHVHMLLSLPPGVAVARTVRIVKTNSSRWIHQTHSRLRGFAWQTGYGAFSVSPSNAAAVVKYIREQERHHRRVSFKEEFISFLKKSGIPYDERHIWE